MWGSRRGKYGRGVEETKRVDVACIRLAEGMDDIERGKELGAPYL